MAWMQWGKLCDPKGLGGMRFQDLRAFNLVLLAKQGWRLQQKSNSLFYRFFQSKYFLDVDFIRAKKGHHLSFAWSIWAAQSLIKEGVQWQVGNGKDIHIWKDRWTTNPSTFRIVSPMKILPIDAKASALIDEEEGVWKTSLVRDIFMEHEADSILSILLSSTLPVDIVWTAAVNGKFSVKSSYHLARKGIRKNRGGELRYLGNAKVLEQDLEGKSPKQG